jgi:hypothetical protein
MLNLLPPDVENLTKNALQGMMVSHPCNKGYANFVRSGLTKLIGPPYFFPSAATESRMVL